MRTLKVDEIVDCQTSLLEFSKITFEAHNGTPFIVNKHHEIICETLERVIIGDIKRLIINIGPRMSKTALGVVNFIAYGLGVNPKSKFIHASYSKTLATNNSFDVKSLVESEMYKQIFPHVNLRYDSKARDHWRTEAGGVMYSTGSDGSITGFGAGSINKGDWAGGIIIDDPHKAIEANSEVKREGVLRWYNNTLASRVNSTETPIILIMQRLAEQDLSGFLLEGGSGEEWHHLCLPTMTDEGESLWEYKYPVEDLKRMEKASPYEFAGQHLQRPSPLGGGIFKDAHWKFYRSDVPPEFEYKKIFADTAMKTKSHNDYSVVQCWGYADNKIYLIDQIRGKWEAPDLRINFKAFWDKHFSYNVGRVTGKLRSAHVEDKASGVGLIQDLKRDGVPIFPVQCNIDKVTRAMDTVPHMAAGFVYLPEGVDWLSDYLMEFSRFTPDDSHKHDDMVDCTMMAVDDMLRGPVQYSGTW